MKHKKTDHSGTYMDNSRIQFVWERAGSNGKCCLPLPKELSIEEMMLMQVLKFGRLQKWHEVSNSLVEYKNLTFAVFAAASQWLSERSVKAQWKPLSESSDLERESSICIRVKQILFCSIWPLADVLPFMNDLLVEIQKLHSPQRQDFKTSEVQLLG